MEITPHVLSENFQNDLNRYAFLGKFASILYHEIGSSLCKIKMNLDLYKDEFNSSVELERLYKIFYEEITRLNKLSTEINQYSRHTEAIPIKINIYRLFESIRENVSKKLNEKEINILNFTQESTIVGDYIKLQTAFLSYFNYSVDSLNKNSSIEISSRTLGETNKILITVKNNGDGVVNMSPIFNTADISRSGLSLLIFKQLIIDLGGSISLLSSDKNDSMLEVQLPGVLNG
jgi:signal transduction histidine kinase